jgi:hypothetical protein
MSAAPSDQGSGGQYIRNWNEFNGKGIAKQANGTEMNRLCSATFAVEGFSLAGCTPVDKV